MPKDDAKNFILAITALFGIFLIFNGYTAFQKAQNILNQETILFFIGGAIFFAIAYFGGIKR